MRIVILYMYIKKASIRKYNTSQMRQPPLTLVKEMSVQGTKNRNFRVICILTYIYLHPSTSAVGSTS